MGPLSLCISLFFFKLHFRLTYFESLCLLDGSQGAMHLTSHQESALGRVVLLCRLHRVHWVPFICTDRQRIFWERCSLLWMMLFCLAYDIQECRMRAVEELNLHLILGQNHLSFFYDLFSCLWLQRCKMDHFRSEPDYKEKLEIWSSIVWVNEIMTISHLLPTRWTERAAISYVY